MSFEPLSGGPYKLTAGFPSMRDPKYGGIEYVRERQWENKSACSWRKSQFVGHLISTDIGPFLPHFIHFFNWRGLFYQEMNTRRCISLRAIFKVSYHKWWLSWLTVTQESRMCSPLPNCVQWGNIHGLESVTLKVCTLEKLANMANLDFLLSENWLLNIYQHSTPYKPHLTHQCVMQIP